jgi:rhomboid protease GluP
MSYTQSHPDGEIIPPTSSTSTVAGYAPPEAYSPEQARKRREYSVWDPRSAPGTYFLLAINIAVYLWMITHGVNPKEPSEAALINYGANHTWLVLHGEWYRLLTATFVHVGLLHLATNMWCLWNLGLLGEPLVGAGGMVAAYLITGAAGNLLSVALHPGLRADGADAIVGAGASGAIFGLAGVLIVLLSSKLLPLPLVERNQLRKSVLWFAVLNFVLAAGVDLSHFSLKVDNGAHFGGFVAGLLMALLMVPRIGAPPELFRRRRNLAVLAAVFALGLLSYAVHSYFLTGRLS